MEIVRSVEMVVSGPGDHHYHVGGGCAQDQQGHGYEPGGGDWVASFVSFSVVIQECPCKVVV